jgi:type VI secretion system secreted protein VgrG
VTFLGGDPDRPIVTGGVHNGRTPVPFALPKLKNKSGIRTHSTPGGVGFNELSFDDTRDAEVVRLRAQRNQEVEVGNDRHASVGHDDMLIVERDQNISVKGDQHVDVCGTQAVAVAGNASHDVSGNADESVGVDARRRVTRDATDTIGANLRVIVGGQSIRETRGSELVRTGGDASQHVMGRASTTVAGNTTCEIAGSLDVTVGDPEEERNASIVVHGNLYASAQGELVLRADRGLTIQCGATMLSIGPDGVKVDGKTLTLTATEAVTLTGKGPTLSLTDQAELAADTVTVLTKGSSLVLDQNAALRGTVVKLNPSDRPTHTSQKGSDKPRETKPLQVTLVDGKYRPYADKRYRLLVDGRVIEGTTRADGSVSEQVPAAAKTADLVLFTGAYPTGPRKRFALSLESIDDTESPKGQQVRLKNLGYYDGPTDGEPHESFRRALTAFQRAHSLEESGVADASTLDALRDKHGH